MESYTYGLAVWQERRRRASGTCSRWRLGVCPRQAREETSLTVHRCSGWRGTYRRPPPIVSFFPPTEEPPGEAPSFIDDGGFGVQIPFFFSSRTTVALFTLYAYTITFNCQRYTEDNTWQPHSPGRVIPLSQVGGWYQQTALTTASGSGYEDNERAGLDCSGLPRCPSRDAVSTKKLTGTSSVIAPLSSPAQRQQVKSPARRSSLSRLC